MDRLTAAIALLLAAHALAAHTRTTDPVAMAPPHALIACAGDVTAALAQAAAAGGLVHLSAGTCTTSATVQLRTGATLNGEGAGMTVLRGAGLAGPVVQVGGALRYQAATGVQIWSLTIDGAATAGAPPGSDADGILVRSASSATITDVEVTAAADNCIKFAGSGTINHSFLHGCQHNGIYVQGIAQPGLPTWPAGPVAISGNRVSGNSLARAPGSMAITGLPAWDGIDCDPWHTRCTITGNEVVGNDILLLDHGVNGWWSGQDSVTGNTVVGSVQAGIDVADHIDGFTVSGNTLDHDTPNAIVVGGAARNGSITGNTVIGGGPIVVHLGTTNVTVSGNVLR